MAREAAILLYSGHEQEYKQAKVKAAQQLRTRILPSNLEIAIELDQVAEERESSTRKIRLIRMREEALQVMTTLNDFHPRLIGSVWRGTAHKNSDIDIIAFSRNPPEVLLHLQTNQYQILTSEWYSLTKEGEREASFHIFLLLRKTSFLSDSNRRILLRYN